MLQHDHLILCKKDVYYKGEKTLVKGRFYGIYYISPFRVYVYREDGAVQDFVKVEYAPLLRRHNKGHNEDELIFEDYFIDISEIPLSQLILLL